MAKFVYTVEFRLRSLVWHGTHTHTRGQASVNSVYVFNYKSQLFHSLGRRNERERKLKQFYYIFFFIFSSTSTIHIDVDECMRAKGVRALRHLFLHTIGSSFCWLFCILYAMHKSHRARLEAVTVSIDRMRFRSTSTSSTDYLLIYLSLNIYIHICVAWTAVRCSHNENKKRNWQATNCRGAIVDDLGDDRKIEISH